MPGTLYPDAPPGNLTLPIPLPGRFTQGVSGWYLNGEDDAAGATVTNPPFLGLFTVPTAWWSGSAVLGGLFRRPNNDWASRLTTAGEDVSEGADVAPDLTPLPDAGATKEGADV